MYQSEERRFEVEGNISFVPFRSVKLRLPWITPFPVEGEGLNWIEPVDPDNPVWIRPPFWALWGDRTFTSF